MKLFNATKKIAAVGAASVIVANAAFAAGLNNYPNNFVEDGKFVGNVVVGSSATADAAAAEALIADLTADLGGDEKVKITYRKSSTSGKELPAVKSNSEINFGELISLSLENSLDDSDSSLLEEGKFKKAEYTQEFTPSAEGVFERSLQDSVDDMEKQAVGVYFADGKKFAEYKLVFSDEVKTSDAKLIGEKIEILGKEFVVSQLSDTKVTLVGGSNKVSLGESEQSTVTVEGKTYDVEVQSVSDDKVLLSINGQSKSVDRYDSEEIAGVNVVVTDLVSSSRDSVKGYAEIVVGGQEIEIRDDGTVKINDEELSDVHEDYEVEAIFEVESSVWKSLTLTYSVDDDVFLEAGDSLEDVLFNAFAFTFEGVENDGNYAENTIETSNEDLTMKLVGMKGDEFTLSDVVTYNGSELALEGESEGDAFLLAVEDQEIVFNKTAVGTRFVVNDGDDSVLYEVKSYAKSDDELTIKKLSEDGSDIKVKPSNFGSKLDTNVKSFVDTGDKETNKIVTSATTFSNVLRLDNELEIDFSNLAGKAANSTEPGVITFTYNEDLDLDESTDEAKEDFTVEVTTDKDGDLVLNAKSAHYELDESEQKLDEDSDFRIGTTRLGTKIWSNSDDENKIVISVPEKQVRAEVSYSTGAVASSTSSAIVDAADVADKKAELEKEGYKIVGTEDVSAVEVEVTAPMTDAEVTEMSNLIVVGGPAVNAVARTLLGVEEYSMEAAGVVAGEAVAKYFADSNSVLVYGYEAADTAAIVEKLVAGEADFE